MALPPRTLPAGARLIHIGPHKTGSTTLQHAMHESRDALAQAGVHYAGRSERARKAGWALGLGRLNGSTRGASMRQWEELVRDVRDAGEMRVCVSNEAFGKALPDQVSRIVEDLGGGQAHVVAVARPLSGYLPSQWQERVKAGMATPYEDWLRKVLADPETPVCVDRDAPEFDRERFNVWWAHDTAELVQRWTDVVGPDRFTLVISDGRDRGLLARTFEELLALPSGTLAGEPGRTNASLPWRQVELIRELNEVATEAGMSRPVRKRLIAHGLVAELTALAGNAPSTRPPAPDWLEPLLEQWAARRTRGLAESGISIVGDLAALTR